MKNAKSAGQWLSGLMLLVGLWTLASGQENKKPKMANLNGNGSIARWNVLVPNSGATLTVSGPDGQIYRKEFASSAMPEFSVFDKDGNKLSDGNYNYEIRFSPVLPAGTKEKLAAARKAGDEDATQRELQRKGLLPQPMVESGSFSIVNGSLVVAGSLEEPDTGRQPISLQRVLPQGAGNTEVRLRNHRMALRPMFDQVIPDDLIVQGSACIGFDCINNESFGVMTIKLKENNTRIGFDDTSVTAGFANNDWQLTANDQPSGGANKFSIDDLTGGRTPFTITAGAPTDSMFVDSSGRLGLGTATPGLKVHLNQSDTPAVRLEQNNSGGFTAQTWDIAGNEANFFVRDLTSGSRLPFRIRPGAPTSSIDIAASGDVGIGTSAPTTGVARVLHIDGTGGSQLHLTAGTPSGGLFSDGTIITHFSDNNLYINNQENGNMFFWTNAGERMRITNIGRIGIGTTAPDQLLSVNGNASKTGGGSWAVFSDVRLKDIKGEFQPGLKAVMQLKPLRYEYRADNPLKLRADGEQIGFSAQDLQKVIPQAVSKSESGYLMVNNDPIMWTMLNAIKEQQKEIAELRAQVQKLSATRGKTRRHGRR